MKFEETLKVLESIKYVMLFQVVCKALSSFPCTYNACVFCFQMMVGGHTVPTLDEIKSKAEDIKSAMSYQFKDADIAEVRISMSCFTIRNGNSLEDEFFVLLMGVDASETVLHRSFAFSQASLDH